jgi:NAD-dependent deacetylase
MEAGRAELAHALSLAKYAAQSPVVKALASAPITRLAALLRAAKCAVVLTGAGMSTESGLPDFRGEGGLWKQNRRFEELASVDALLHEYPEFVEFYRWRLGTLAQAKPNPGHEILASWQRRKLISTLVTQNVDGYHERAGSEGVLCLHGSLQRIHCHRCEAEAPLSAFLSGPEPACGSCGGRLRPSVVLFGESLDSGVLGAAFQISAQADLFLVLGSSLLVSPANTLPRIALERGSADLVIINREPTQYGGRAVLDIRASIGETLAAVERELCSASDA